MSRYGIPGVLAAFVVLLPGVAQALGLGQIQSDTRIGQTLSARIPILAADANSVQGLSVGLASPDAYKQAGVSEPDFLFSLKFQLEQGASGPYILITSDKPVRLPFLNLLVHASWPSGEVTRQYTVLLNPPIFAAGSSGAAASVPAATVARPAYRPSAQQSREQTPQRSLPRRYGPIQPGETLWHIASGLARDAGVSVNQMMMALYRANPQAFSGNINRLRAGPVLRVPSLDEVDAISLATANREVVRQNRAWQSVQAAGAAGSAVAVAPVKNAGNHAGSVSAATGAAAAGEVVLTAPEVTAETAATGGMAKMSGSSTAGAGKTVKAAALPAASTTAPVKVHSKEMANLAAATRAVKKPAAAHPALNAYNSVSTAKTRPEKGANSSLLRWITTPEGWIEIALVLILLAILIFFLMRYVRQRRGPAEADADGSTPEPQGDSGIQAGAEMAGSPTDGESAPAFGAGVADVDAIVAESDTGKTGAELDISSYVDESPFAMPAAEAETGEDDAPIKGPHELDISAGAMGDVLAEADFHAGHGDHAGAAGVLRTALAQEPERQDIRRRLLEELFSAGDALEFRTEAERFRELAPPESDWRTVAIMGRQLLPGDSLFTDAESRQVAADEFPAEEETAPEEADALDFDLELDQLSRAESVQSMQDDFERTLGELSTMIESYVPESDKSPVELHLPPEEAEALPKTGRPMVVAEEVTLEFELEETDRPAAEESSETQAEEPVSAPSPAIEEAVGEQDISGTKLDLARAYLDMGDQESARDILEEVLDEGDEARREEAQRLLETLA